MPRFKYKALEKNGRIAEDTVEASDRAEVLNILREKSLSPMSVQEESEGMITGGSGFHIGSGSGKHISRKNITQFTSQLSALVNAKMNLAKALQALSRQSEGEAMQPLINSLLDDVQKGKNLSEAFERYPEHFSALYINMIKVGEVGGVLDKALERLVVMREKDEDLIGKIKGALTYPCVMALVMLASVIVMLTFVIPKFSNVFTQMGSSLPFSTRVVLAVSGFFEHWWWLVIIAVAALGALGYFMLQNKEYRLRFDLLKLKIPVLGKIILNICISRFSLSMGALLENGVSMMKALDATVPITGNAYIESILRDIAREVREGESLSSALRKRADVFPSLMTGMVGTGEEAGSLDEMLSNVGVYFSKVSEEKINTLTTLFEPVMIVVMGGIVGFIISAILLPIFNVSTSIH